VNTLLIFLIVGGFFVIAQWAAVWVRELVHRGLDLPPSLLPHPSGGRPLAIEIDPPCGDVTLTTRFSDPTTIAFYQASLTLQPNIAARVQRRGGIV